MERILWWLFLPLLLWSAEVGAAQYKVLIVHSYGPELPWVQQCNRGISSALPEGFALRFEYLDTKRIPESEYSRKAEEAMQVYHAYAPDLVMLGDDNALRLLGPRMAADGLPIVFFGINGNPRSYFKSIPPNVSGRLEILPLFSWVRYIRRIMPEAKQCLILMDRSETSDALISHFFGENMHASVDGVAVDYRIVSTFAEWKRAVNESAGYQFITIPLFHTLKDEKGAVVPVEEVARWVSAESRIPVFAYQDYMVGNNGVVGAYVIPGEAHAFSAAELARNILLGEASDKGGLSADHVGTFYFNHKQLERFGLTLPPGIAKEALFTE
jgi:ABC-type uncharacterized transport system substrate-binding protein